MYPNRTICDVLEAMRDCYKTRNFSYLEGLIEEAQLFGNRMESALSDVSDIKRLHGEREKLNKQVDKLRNKKEALSEKK